MTTDSCPRSRYISLHTIIVLISTIGCFWHLIEVTLIFFQFPTSINLEFKRDVTVQIPSLTFCVNLTHTIREDYMISRFPELEPLLNRSESKYYYLAQFFDKLTFKERLTEATYGPEDVFLSCSVLLPMAFEGLPNYHIGDYINCSEISRIREYLTYYKKCFQIASQLGNESSDNFVIDHDLALRDNGFPLLEITINNTFLTQASGILSRPLVFMHSRTVPFLDTIGDQTDVHPLNPMIANYWFTYSLTTLELLPWPYETDCRNNSAKGFRSVQHCMNHCRTEYFASNFNSLHPDVPMNDEYIEKWGDSSYRPQWLLFNRTIDKEMSNFCGKKCEKREDCRSEYYFFSIISKIPHEKKNASNNLEIAVFPPAGINKHYSHSPRQHVSEFICYFGSVVSFWFGFSIITTSKIAHKIHELYIKTNIQKDPSRG